MSSIHSLRPRVACDEDLIAVGAGDELFVIDIGDSLNPNVVHRIDFNSVISAVAISLGTTFVSIPGRDELLSVDMTTGEITERLAIGENVRDVAAKGDLLYVLTEMNLHVVSLDGAPSIISTTESPIGFADFNRRLFVGDDILYAIHGQGYNTFSLADPENPTLIAAGATPQIGWQQIVTNGSGLGVAAVGISDLFESNVSLYDVSDPTQTNELLAEIETPDSTATAVAIHNGLGYVVDFSGMHVFNYLPFDTEGEPPSVSISVDLPPGTTVAEGMIIPVRVDASDDVQVRNIDMLVNGETVRSDGSFPWDFTLIATSDIIQGDVLTLQARAVDTGANAALSDVVELDASDPPPIITSIDPPDGSTRYRGLQSVEIRMSEPVDPTAITQDTFAIIEAGDSGAFDDGDDVSVEIIDVKLTEDDTFIELTTGPLGEGLYRLRIVEDEIVDRTEQPLGTGEFLSHFRVVSVDAPGLVLKGIAQGDQLGWSVNSGGDFNGDGYLDLIAGAPGSNVGSFIGEGYVVYGGPSLGGTTGSLELDSLDGSNGFVLNGVDKGGYNGTGVSVSWAGDFNGDNFDDILIGVPGSTSFFDREGWAYIVFGGIQAGVTGSFQLSSLNGANGFVMNGIERGDLAGRAVSGAGDINDDGLDDIIVGAPFADPGGLKDAGEAYVVFGSDAILNGGILGLASLDGSNGFVIRGVDRNDRLGFSVSRVGDMNGDGISDIIVGAERLDSDGEDNLCEPGGAYVIFGHADVGATGRIDVSALDGGNGFVIESAELICDQAGFSVSGGGDINGDGYDDAIIGAPGTVGPAPRVPAAYVVFGASDVGAGGSLNLGTLDGIEGFVINDFGLIFNAESVSLAHDFNGDGYDDVLVSSTRNPFDPSVSTFIGQSYVIFGKSDIGSGGEIYLPDVDSPDGFAIGSVTEGDKIIVVASADDVNADGFADIFIGDPLFTRNGKTRVGEGYVVFGGSGLGSQGTLNLRGIEVPPRGDIPFLESPGAGDLASSIDATSLGITYSSPLTESSVTDRTNYMLVHAGADRELGTGDDVTVSLLDVTYDPLSGTATLIANVPVEPGAERLPQNGYELTVGIGVINDDRVSLNNGFHDSIVKFDLTSEEADEDDSIATATPTGIGVDADGEFAIDSSIGNNSLGDLDVDIYAFGGAAEQKLIVDLSRYGVNNSNVLARVFDPSGNEIAMASTTDAETQASLLMTLDDTGVFHVGISGAGNAGYDPNVTASGLPDGIGLYHLEIQTTGVVRWIAPGGGFWDDTGNWERGILPDENSRVIIEVPGTVAQIVHRVGDTRVQSISSDENIVLTGGSLDVATEFVTRNLNVESGSLVAGSVEVLNNFLAEDGDVSLSALDVTFNLTVRSLNFAAVEIDVGNFFIVQGGVIRATDIHVGTELLIESGSIQADRIELADLTLGDAEVRVLDLLVVNGEALVSDNGRLIFGSVGGGAQRIEGAGEVIVVSGLGGVASIQIDGGSTLTIGPDIAMRLRNGNAIIERVGGDAATLINNGLISAENFSQSLVIDTDVFTNLGTLRVVEDSTLTIDSASWSGSGGIAVGGGTINLGGEFPTGAVSNLERTGGVVNLTGRLDNTGATLALDATTGSWTLDGGTILGGTVATFDGVRLVTASGSTSRLSAVTLNGELELSYTLVQTTVTVANGLTLNGSITLGNSTKLAFEGTQTLDGSGEVVFDGTFRNSSQLSVGSTLTIGPDMTLRGRDAFLSVSGALVSEGLVSAEGGELGLFIDDLTITETGVIEAVNGALLRIASGTGSHQGLIHADDATLDIEGSLAVSGGGFELVKGGVVRVSGTLDNTGNTLVLNTSDGSFVVNGGEIIGGVLGHESHAVLSFTNNPDNLLTRVTSDIDLDLTASSAQARVVGGLTLNGTATLGNESSLIFEGSQTLDGIGTVLFDADPANPASLLIGGGSTLTIAPNWVVSGGNGNIGRVGIGSATLISQGMIAADVSGRSNSIGPDVFSSSGVVEASNGGTLNLLGSWSNGGTIRVLNGTTNLGGSFATTDIGAIERTGGAINIIGTLNNAGETLTLDAATGTWTLMGGTILGGVVEAFDGETLNVTSGGNRFEAVTLNTDVEINSSSATFIGGLTLNRALNLQGGSQLIADGTQRLDGVGEVVLNPGLAPSRLTIPTGAGLTIGPGITVRGGGSIDQLDQGGDEGAVLVSEGLISADVSKALLIIFPQDGGQQGPPGGPIGSFTNIGTLDARNGGFLRVEGELTNYSVDILSGGAWRVMENSTLVLPNADIRTNNAKIVLDGQNSALRQDPSLKVPVSALVNFDTNASSSSFTIRNGRNFSVALDFSNAGDLFIGAPSSFSATANYTQLADGVLNVEIGGLVAGVDFGQLNVSKLTTLSGVLNITLVDGYEPDIGDSFQVMTYGSHSGEFTDINGLDIGNGKRFEAVYNDTDLTLTVVSVP